MLDILAAALLMTSRSEVPDDLWRCRNQVEVWCAVDGCAAKAEDETTPLDIWARGDTGEVSICAYSGCWEGGGRLSRTKGRLLWAADGVPFTARSGGFSADVTLLIIEKDGVGFVRVGGFATPVLCLKAPPDLVR
ncbi:MAG: hypothetical protein ACX939_02550 [Hyphococcus sp.]